MPSGKSISISPVSNFLVTFLNKLLVRYRWFLIYDKKKIIGHKHLFFSNHLKSTKIKQSSFGKHQNLNTPKLNIHILTENRQNIPIYGITGGFYYFTEIDFKNIYHTMLIFLFWW
jgi:hypothetical protein